MKRMMTTILVATAALVAAVAAPVTAAAQDQSPAGVTINGAGASFPYPLYAQWAFRYEKLTGLKVNYQSIGSGGGIAQIKAGTVDFGASDAPLEIKELQEAGLVQFPMVVGGVVPVINVKGIAAGQVRLSPDVLVDIFLGKITRWNDSKITALNSGVKLPDTGITVVHRADSSGTTWIYSNYLAAVSPAWKDKVGAGKALEWPVGVAGKGNEGVAAYVQRMDGSIGYVEYAYAIQNNLATVLLQNRAGKFVSPTIDTFQAAAANADWASAPGYYVVLVDQPGDNTWPITGASFILIHAKIADGTKAKAMLTFFDWAFRHGNDTARELHYVPMPANVVELVGNTWAREVTSGGKPVWTAASAR